MVPFHCNYKTTTKENNVVLQRIGYSLGEAGRCMERDDDDD